MSVLLQTFVVSVVLKKLVHRTNSMAGAASAPQQQIDLTNYLGDTSSITTIKNLDEPGGGFTVTFPDQIELSLQDTIYALIEPMDMVEIRATRSPQNYVGQKLPLIMRGFVSSVQRQESIGEDGAPQRQVVVRGIDSGKLWMVHQILFQYLLASGVDFLARFDLQAQLGLDATFEPVSDYMAKVVQYMNDRIAELAAYGKQMVPQFKLVATVQQGQAYIGGLTGKNGPLWSFVETFADRPWNEAFIVDEEDGPTLYFRPAPYKDLDGNFVLYGASDPGTVNVTAVEVIALDVTRSDARVANLYWSPPYAATIDTAGFLTSGIVANALPVDPVYENNNAALYGERMLEAITTLKPNDATIPPTMLPPNDRPAANQTFLSWTLLRASQLRAMNRDASVHEEGTAVLNGRETYRIGQYLKITRGTLVSECYMASVTHTILPLRSWTTSVGFKRGMGFYNRDKATNVPWFAEGRPGPYTP